MGEDRKVLLNEARKGDMDAFAQLFEPLRLDVYRLAYRHVGPDNADDVTMDTFLKAWRAIPRFTGRSSLKTWLYRITYNCAVDFIRKRTRRKEVWAPEDGPDHKDLMADREDEPGPDDMMIASELAGQVRGAMSEMSDEHRATLLLRYSDDMSYAEIAAATGVSIGTVMSRLFNGKRKLGMILDGKDY
jgi:RNA polymerase sigma-70 factor (ECF subfamily)